MSIVLNSLLDSLEILIPSYLDTISEVFDYTKMISCRDDSGGTR